MSQPKYCIAFNSYDCGFEELILDALNFPNSVNNRWPWIIRIFNHFTGITSSFYKSFLFVIELTFYFFVSKCSQIHADHFQLIFSPLTFTSFLHIYEMVGEVCFAGRNIEMIFKIPIFHTCSLRKAILIETWLFLPHF